MNITNQTTSEQSRAVVETYYQAGVRGRLTDFAPYVHPDFSTTAPNYLPWGGVHAGAAFFRDEVLSKLPDVLDFGRFSYDAFFAANECVVALVNFGITGCDATIKISEHWTVSDGKATSIWVAYFEPQALLDKLGIAHGLSRQRIFDMTTYTHQTAPTQYVEARGIRFAYRRFGKTGSVPLVFNMHFTGTMDHWDPAVTDGLAKEREVILFNNAGVSSSSGEVPTTVEEMGSNAVAFIKGLGLTKVDVLGFSIGGFVAQEIALQAPDLVRRLVLVGTGPRGGQSMDTGTPEAQQIFGATYDPPDDLWLKVFFTESEASQAAGREFLKRFRRRTENRDPEVNEKVAWAQREAIGKWGAQGKGSFDYLKNIAQPTLVVNGDNDVIIYTINSYILQQNIPNAQLILYPDAGHGSQYQYAELFVRHVSMFLSDSRGSSPSRRFPSIPCDVNRHESRNLSPA